MKNIQRGKITIKPNDKINNIIANKVERFNKYDRNRFYKLLCTNCNQFYTERTKGNFNTRFKGIRGRFTEGKSRFVDLVLKEDHERKQYKTS